MADADFVMQVIFSILSLTTDLTYAAVTVGGCHKDVGRSIHLGFFAHPVLIWYFARFVQCYTSPFCCIILCRIRSSAVTWTTGMRYWQCVSTTAVTTECSSQADHADMVAQTHHTSSKENALISWPTHTVVEFKLTILMFKALLVYYCHICEMNVVLCHGPKLVWVRGCLHSLLSLVLSVWKVHWEHNYTCSGVCWSYICLIVAIAHGHIYLLASFLGLAHCMRHCWFQCIGLSNSNQFPLSLQRKLSVVWTLLDRCSQMVTKEQDCQAEEAHIQQALYRCGYPEWTIERVKSDMEVQKGRARNRRSLDLSQ